jgi:putative endonuclease
MQERAYSVYILTNKNDTVLYIGVTNNLPRRLAEHRSGLVQGFTKRYNLHKLVYHEVTGDILAAMEREKELKGWIRERKEQLIQRKNPSWRDLSETLDIDDE